VPQFRGFPVEGRDFFEAVGRSTTWETVSSLRALHERAIRAPMEAFTSELAGEFGPAKVYNLHRSPNYWVEQWAYVEVVDTIAYGVSLSLDGLWVEGGWLRSSADQVERYRARAGSQLEELVASLEAAHYALLGERLKRAPSRLLAYRSLVAGRSLGAHPWLHTREALDRVRREWRLLRPFVEWLAANVGEREKKH
jgi:hypothetical protein